MKCIHKGAEPDAVLSWKALANAAWQPSFDNLQNPQKDSLKQALLREQGYLCCYCNGLLSDDDSHIEHFCPQSTDASKDLEYANLHVSCLSNQKKGAALHCGMAKDDWFDPALTLSPQAADIEQRLRYSADGHVYPQDADDIAAHISIERLALDCAVLTGKRDSAIRGLLDEKFLSTTNDVELGELYRALLQRDRDDRFMPYAIALRQQVAGLMGGQV